MAEFKGVRFYQTEAESFKDEPFESITVDMGINEVRRKSKGEMVIDFSYNVDYKDNVAKLGLRGYLFLEGSEKELDKYVGSWRKQKKLPKELTAPLANLITFTSEVNGVLVARAIGIPAPVIPPKIELGKAKK
jgi:hypothetical protein